MYSDKRTYYTFLAAGTVLGLAAGYLLCHTFLNSIAFAITGFYFSKLIYDLGKTIPVDSFILSLASMQWLLGPALTYSGYSPSSNYIMYVPAETYFPFAMTGVIILNLGIRAFFKRRLTYSFESIENKIRERLQLDPNFPYSLIAIGLISGVARRFLPASLGFLMVLLWNLSFIGVIYLLYVKSTLKWWSILGIAGVLFVSALSIAMFHDLLLWLSFIAFYIAKVNKFKPRTSLIFVIAGIGFAFVIQLVKTEFRTYIWGGYGGNKVSLFIDLATKEISAEANPEEYNTKAEGMIVRINQGWIISRIMYHIPAEQDFIHGQSIKSAIYAGIVPRVVDPTKQVVGGQDYFERFTGLALINGTSMGASLLGEGYANFGQMGGLIFLGIYGLFIGWVLRFIFKLAYRNPTIILWLPFLFLQVVKAESDLLRVFNHLTKAALVLFLLYWFLGKQLKWKI